MASTDYAQSVSDDLRQQVYDALRFVAQGFLDYPGNDLNATPETCKLIYDSSLTLLYRLLFIFYAEARDLLPLHSNSTYQRRYSLHAIKNDVATSLQEDLFPDSGVVWSRLKVLVHIIDLGRPPLNVTTFNGGLFDPKRHTFLEDYTVGDLSLCQAIDKLARVKSQFVDYRDLAERHLGTIYEGLLEYTLQVATEPMVELKSSSRIVPAEGVQKKDIAADAEAARKRLDKGQYWWELRACDYYDAFEKSKIFWPDMAKFPRFSWDDQGKFSNDKGFFLQTSDPSLLGILQSRVAWFCISRLCAPLAERLGLIIYQQKIQYMTQLPIPSYNEDQRDKISNLSQQIKKIAKQRYEIRRRMAHRIQSDLGAAQTKLNQRLETWWDLSFREFREELVKVFKRDIPLKDRDDWEQLLQERSLDIRRMTEEISRLEIELNKAVYAAFCLDDEEIKLIEQEIKYQYGEW